MINEYIDARINGRMLAKDKFRTDVLRLMKAKFLEYRTAKGAKPLDDAAEIQLLKKMVSQRKDSASQYIAGGSQELADNERAEAKIIEEFLPEEVGEDAINSAIDEAIASGLAPEKKNMGAIIKVVKAKYPMADGKTTSMLVAKKLN